jgi:DUF1680 family protein
MSRAWPSSPVVGPLIPTERAARLRPLGLDRVAITDGAWTAWQRQVAEESLPHVAAWLERMGAFAEYRRLDSTNPDRESEQKRELPWAGDSDLYKALEAASWSLASRDDEGLREFIDSTSALLARAQESDGYLHTQIQNGRGVVGFNGASVSGRFQAPAGEELYCLGHLLQAGIAHRRATGLTSLFDVARKAADCIVESFRDRPDYADGHPEVEMALVEMYRETGDRRYLETADRFLGARGYGKLAAGAGTAFAPNADYLQDGVPVREQTDIVGHSVCALNLLCGMVDVAVESGDAALLDAALAQWDSLSGSKVYLTGAVGSRNEGESFGDPYELPQDIMYGETCATVSYVLLAWRLLVVTGEARFADALERAVLNLLRASVALDGRGFYYCNPSQRRSPRPASDPEVIGRLGDSPGTRAPWFVCACCPPNVLRVIASFGAYLATVDDTGIQLHQYTSATVDAGEIAVRVETDYPDTGVVKVAIERSPDEPWTLGLRKPGWAKSVRVAVSGVEIAPEVDELGYVRITRAWRAGDEVVVTIPLAPRLTIGHPSVDAVRGQVAVERGPIVYALESADQAEGIDLEHVSLIPGGDFDDVRTEIAGHPVIAIRARGLRRDDATRRQGLWQSLEEAVPEAGTAVPLTFVPYGLWANRGPSTLRVFVPLAQHQTVGEAAAR